MCPRPPNATIARGRLARRGVVVDVVALLRKVSIFAELPDVTLNDLAGRMRPRGAEAGSVIVSQEEPGDSLFVIGRGKVKVVLYGEIGREIILSILRDGDFFGEMLLLDW